jgi:acetylornithine deacetylase/succinyl-diaminopimelate desuccinylase-like protein
MGSIFATRPGENNDIPPIALGSHLDTQPKGGKYDGILGVNSALEVLRTVHVAGLKTYAPLCIVNWTNEEGARFNPAMIASGVWGGAFELEYAHQRMDSDGKTIKSELQRIGFLGQTGCSYDVNPFSAHFECHIEQGI